MPPRASPDTSEVHRPGARACSGAVGAGRSVSTRTTGRRPRSVRRGTPVIESSLDRASFSGGMHYCVVVNGVPRRIELPFVTGVMADLSGQRVEELLPVKDRRFLPIDADRFDEFVAFVRPRVA